MVGLLEDFTVAVYGQIQLFGEGVDHGNTDTVQSTRHLVGAAIEFAAGVEHGHDHLGGGAAFFRVDIDRDAPPVVGDGNGAVRVHDDLDFRAITRQGLIDGIVHHLEYHMVQTGAVIRIADIHPRALTNGV